MAENLHHFYQNVDFFIKFQKVKKMENFNKSKTKTSKTKTSKAKTSKAKTSKTETSKTKTSKAKTSKAKSSKTETSKTKTSKAKTSKTKTPKYFSRESFVFVVFVTVFSCMERICLTVSKNSENLSGRVEQFRPLSSQKNQPFLPKCGFFTRVCITCQRKMSKEC